MKKSIIILSTLLFVCSTANGQSFLGGLVDRVKNTVENKVENKITEKVDQGVNDVLDGKIGKKGKKNKKTAEEAEEAQEAATWTCSECGTEGNTGKFCSDCGAKKPGGKADKAEKADKADKADKKTASKTPAKQISTNYAKSDFVPGDEIFFDDPVQNERLGEFPLHWDFISGEECEVVELNGEQVIKLAGWYSEICPLIKEKDYLPEEFTVEFDIWSNDKGGSRINDHLDFVLINDEYEMVKVSLNPAYNEDSGEENMNIIYEYIKPSGDNANGSAKGSLLTPLIQPNSWLKVQASFNKRAFKFYVNGVRMVNLPNVARPTRMKLVSVSNCDDRDRFYLKNIRIAKGAVPLYDRLMSDGKIVTYAITFETGKADLKPESMIEINRIAKLMKENPGLEFEVQGHCDATGSDKVNDPLSQKRAEAIVAAIVDLGIAEARLTPVGKGSHSPIASNSTDEGRSKNRRVEFVKK